MALKMFFGFGKLLLFEIFQEVEENNGRESQHSIPRCL